MTSKSVILYVEDNKDNRLLVRRVLEAEGYTMVEASSAEDAMERIKTTRPNVMRGDREKSLEAGCDGYIQKPIDIDQLTQQIERFLARHP